MLVTVRTVRFNNVQAGGLCPNFEIHGSDYEQEEYCAQEQYHKLRAQLRILQYRQPMS